MSKSISNLLKILTPTKKKQVRVHISRESQDYLDGLKISLGIFIDNINKTGKPPIDKNKILQVFENLTLNVFSRLSSTGLTLKKKGGMSPNKQIVARSTSPRPQSDKLFLNRWDFMAIANLIMGIMLLCIAYNTLDDLMTKALGAENGIYNVVSESYDEGIMNIIPGIIGKIVSVLTEHIQQELPLMVRNTKDLITAKCTSEATLISTLFNNGVIMNCITDHMEVIIKQKQLDINTAITGMTTNISSATTLITPAIGLVITSSLYFLYRLRIIISGRRINSRETLRIAPQPVMNNSRVVMTEEYKNKGSAMVPYLVDSSDSDSSPSGGRRQKTRRYKKRRSTKTRRT